MNVRKEKTVIKLDRVPYSPMAKGLALNLIVKLRQSVTLPDEAEKSRRFNDDLYVLNVLESHFDLKDFLLVPHFAVEQALIEAAKADYWYQHEKHYSFDEETSDCEIIGDEE